MGNDLALASHSQTDNTAETPRGSIFFLAPLLLTQLSRCLVPQSLPAVILNLNNYSAILLLLLLVNIEHNCTLTD